MNLILPAAVIISLPTAASFLLMLRKLQSANRFLPLEEDWQWLPFQPVSPGRYHPMQRLLDGRDFEFLVANSAFDRKWLRQFRSQRRQMFRCYLACLSSDYTRLCAAIKMLMVQSPCDRPDLAGLLVRQRVIFTLGMMGAEFCLALHTLGIGTLRARHLIQTLDTIGLELKSLARQALDSDSMVLEAAQDGAS